MRVLHVITSLNLGGAQMMLARHLAALGPAARGHAVLSLMPPGIVANEITRLGVKVVSAGLPAGSSSPSVIAHARRAVLGAAPDLVQGWMYHGNLAASLGVAMAARALPVVWSVHHSIGRLAAETLRLRLLLAASVPLSRTVEAIVYCSAVSAGEHEAFGFDHTRRRIIPNGVDCTVFRPRAGAREHLRTLAGVPAGRLLVGSVARDHPMKDHATLVRAVRLLLEAGVDVHAVVIGEGHETGSARREADDLGIGERVTTLGARLDVEELVPGLDVFVMSSAWGETFSLATAEALASGVPAVVTDVGDCPRVLGDCGRVVAPADPDALAGAMHELLALPAGERAALGARGRERIASLYSIESHAAAVTELLQTILARRAARTAARRRVPEVETRLGRALPVNGPGGAPPIDRGTEDGLRQGGDTAT